MIAAVVVLNKNKKVITHELMAIHVLFCGGRGRTMASAVLIHCISIFHRYVFVSCSCWIYVTSMLCQVTLETILDWCNKNLPNQNMIPSGGVT